MRTDRRIKLLTQLLLPALAMLAPLETRAQRASQPPGVPATMAPNTQYREGVFIGPRAGAAGATGTSFGLVGIGPDALRSLTSAGAEIVAVGPYAGEFITNAYGSTMLGEHTIGFDNPSYTTAIGNDVMRDTINAQNSTVVGAVSYVDGVSVGPITVMGALSLQGNAGSVMVGGTVTVGDVLSIALTTTNGSVTGLPYTASYTVVGGDTPASIAAALATTLSGHAITATLADGNTTATENGVSFSAAGGNPIGNIRLHFPGGSVDGWKILATPSCSGTCTETITYSPAFSGNSNVVVGQKSLLGLALTAANNNVVVGDNVLPNLYGAASGNTYVGASAGASATTDNNNVVVGYSAGQGATGMIYSTLVGQQAGSGIGAGTSNNVVVGAQPIANACITTGGLNLEIGTDACVPSPTASNQQSISNIIFGTGNSGRGSTASTGQIGIATKAPNATLTVGDASNTSTQGNHIGFLGTAPVLSAAGTTPSLDATATDAAGTVTEGTTATGFVLTFNHSFATAPHCAVSSPNGATLTSYSVTTSALTLVNPSASGSKWTYWCPQ